MKRVLSLVLALVLVLGMMPTFAAGETGAQELYANGFITGANGDLMVDKSLTRAEMAVILAELFGLKDEAMNYAAPANFSDVSEHWAHSYIAYGQANGWFGGYPNGTYNPEGTVTSQELASFILNALGYEGNTDYTWETAVAYTATLGINVGSSAALTRGAAFDSIWETVNTPKKGSEVALGVELGKLDAPVVEPTELEVVSVKATNLKEVVVAFNTTPDEDTAEDESLYSIDGDTAVTVESADLDGKVVTLTLETGATLENDEDYTLVIDSELIEDEVEFTATDVELPQALSLELTGPSTLEITYSEPIAATSTIEVEIEDGVYGATATADDSNVVEVELSASSLEEDSYSIKVTGAEDFAGYEQMRKTFTLNYVEDKTAPTPVVVSADQTEVVIDFGKPVESTDDETILDETYFYHSYTSYQPDTVEEDNGEYTLTFTTNPLPENDVKFVVDYDGDHGEIRDLWGNEMTENAVFTISIKADNEKPVVNKLDVEDEQTLLIYFSEGISSETANDEDNYVVLDSDDEEVDINDIVWYGDKDEDDDDYDKAVVEITFDDVLDGNYTIEISGIEDDALVNNTIVAKTYAFTVNDTTGLDLDTEITVTGVDTDTADYIYVRFDDDMDKSATTKANYLFDGEELPSNATITFFGGNDAVKITFPTEDDQTVVGKDLTVGRLTDSDGNVSTLLSAKHRVDPITNPAVTSAELVGYKTLEVVYEDTVLTTVNTKGIEVSNNGGATWGLAASVGLLVDDGDSTITVTLKSAQQLDSDATAFGATNYQVRINHTDDFIKADTGVFAADEVFTTVDDGIAPTIDEDTIVFSTTDATLTFTLSEAVGTVNASLAATDFVMTYDGDVLVAGTDYTVTFDGADVTIEFTSEVDLTAKDYIRFGTVDAPKYVKDAAGNKVEKLAADTYDDEYAD